MKKQIPFLLVVIIILSSQLVNSQPWRRVTKEAMSPASSAFFLTPTVGWYTGDYMTVFKTLDAGKTWTEQYRGSEVSSKKYESIYFLNENVGYAGGTNAALAKTNDGGNSWTPLVLSDAVNTIESIHFIDELKGWVLVSSADSAAIFKTADGGASWTRVLTHKGKALNDMTFYGTHGVAVGGGVGVTYLYYTTDGDNWSLAPVPFMGEISYTRNDMRTVYMVNENLVYATGWGSTVGLQPTIHLKSTDGGASWTCNLQETANRTYCNLNDNYFKDENNGVAAGGLTYPGTIVVRTTDGGATWLPLDMPFGFSVNFLKGIGNELWALGGGNTIYSPDFGNTWEMLNDAPSTTLYSVVTFDGKTIYAGGMNGNFLKSTDSGKNWKNGFQDVNGVSTNIQSMFFLDNNIGFTSNSFRLLCKTTDGGESWTGLLPDTSGNSVTNYGLYFFDENTGFVAGSFGTNTDIIYKTTDGGASWSTKIGQVAENLSCITFTSATNGVAGATDSKIIYTTDAGESWQPATLTDVTEELNVNSFAFIDESKGFAAGEKILLGTIDGGKTWSLVPGLVTEETLVNVSFKDAQTGIVVGDKYIFKTTDGGVTWNDVNDTLVTDNLSLRGVAYDENGYAWICGGSGLVITDAPETPDVSVAEGNSPYTFELTQNYPNPFNPSTTINYSVENRSKVTIKIYDVMGKEVDVLFDGESEAGSHSIKYNAGKLASGVYFCSMQVGNKIKSLKMSLIK